jgi:hypothetical protein
LKKGEHGQAQQNTTRARRRRGRPRHRGRQLRRRRRGERKRLVLGWHDDAVASGSSRSLEPLGSPAERRDAADRRNVAKVKAAALAEVPNATIVRIETDADGHAAYEAHVVKADGAPATVYVDKQFGVVGVESR